MLFLLLSGLWQRVVDCGGGHWQAVQSGRLLPLGWWRPQGDCTSRIRPQQTRSPSQPLINTMLLICLTIDFSIFLLGVKCDAVDSSHIQTRTAMASSPLLWGLLSLGSGTEGPDALLREGRDFSACLSLPGSNVCGASPTGCQEQLHQVVAIENVSKRTNAWPELGPWDQRAKLFLVYEVHFYENCIYGLIPAILNLWTARQAGSTPAREGFDYSRWLRWPHRSVRCNCG